MSTAMASLRLEELSVQERLDLIERLWDSLPDAPTADEVPHWHLAVVEQRLAAFERNPKPGIPWREVLGEPS